MNNYRTALAATIIGTEKKFSKYAKTEDSVRHGCIFTSDVFDLYSETIRREQGFIIGCQKLKYITYTENTVLRADK